jgi:CheY-like chemotaxis protein
MTRVLIVDDEAGVRANLAAYLEDDGFEVATASSGEEALQHATHFRPDVCIMDMRLPGMDGNDAIRAIHAQWPEVVFVIHTATAGYVLPEDLRAIGLADEHVYRKPVTDMAPLAEYIVALAHTKRYSTYG